MTNQDPPSETVMKPSETPPKILRFPNRRQVLPVRRPALSASTEDDRLTWPVRTLSLVAGLMFAAIGFGLVALIGWGFREALRQGSVPLHYLGYLLLPLGIALYGIVLGGRGIVGRPWGHQALSALSNGMFSGANSRKAAWVTWTVLALLAVSSVVGWFREGPTGMETALTLFALFLHVFFHEIGHLAAARAVGYTPRGLMAGPLFLRVDGPQVRFSFNRSWLPFFTGFAWYEPENRTVQRDLWVVSAGPLTNFILAGVALDAWGWPNPSGISQVFLRSFIALGFALAFLNLLPLPRVSGGFALDGREILDLWRGKHHSRDPL